MALQSSFLFCIQVHGHGGVVLATHQSIFEQERQVQANASLTFSPAKAAAQANATNCIQLCHGDMMCFVDAVLSVLCSNEIRSMFCL